ncbi:hypothetical protein MAPG_08812 [Magnaporthiopsis poae ATCC 64411]|uniref:Aspergillopepsin-2 n=1 Tax=Magnaporthiopsis poae (strain ATCC 64411 / 73-15) TaxID=644358 RepID=A0A0C4E8B2_MAGP6|nr:hypothetical protein MAPG_08812 [Magnaporthiopsis poae ATCC 64411]
MNCYKKPRHYHCLKMRGPFLTAAAAAGLATAMTVPTSGVSNAELTNGVMSPSSLGAQAAGPLHFENWSGATRAGTGFNKIVGTVNVPDWRNRADGWDTGMYMAVRLDGFPGCGKDSPLASIGHVTSPRGSNGDMRANGFRASWSWGGYIGGSENILSFPLRVGDEVHMELIVLTPTKVNGTIKNLNTGQEVYRIMNNPDGFCGTTANWVVGTYSGLGRPRPLTEFFGNVTFTGASATTGAGETLNLAGAQAMVIDQTWMTDPTTGPVQGGLQTDCNIVGDSSVTCKRLFPTPP